MPEPNATSGKIPANSLRLPTSLIGFRAKRLGHRKLHHRAAGRSFGEALSSRKVSVSWNRSHGTKMFMDITRIKITPGDRQVISLFVQGCSNKEIAAQLKVSPRTVKQHLRSTPLELAL